MPCSEQHNNSYRTHPEGPQIISIICDTRYLRHPRLSDGSRGGVRIVGGPRRGPKRFPLHIWPDTPSLRELVASMAPPETQDPRSWITLRFGSRLLMDEPGCPPGICLSLGMLSLVVLIVIITGLVAVSVRLLPFHGLGCLRDLRDLRDPWWLWWLWWLWRYSTYLVAGFTRCSAADRTESGHDPRPIFSLVTSFQEKMY